MNLLIWYVKGYLLCRIERIEKINIFSLWRRHSSLLICVKFNHSDMLTSLNEFRQFGWEAWNTSLCIAFVFYYINVPYERKKIKSWCCWSVKYYQCYQNKLRNLQIIYKMKNTWNNDLLNWGHDSLKSSQNYHAIRSQDVQWEYLC